MFHISPLHYNRGLILSKNNVPSDSVITTQQILEGNGRLMIWSAKSLDFNIIEHIWDLVKRISELSLLYATFDITNKKSLYRYGNRQMYILFTCCH